MNDGGGCGWLRAAATLGLDQVDVQRQRDGAQVPKTPRVSVLGDQSSLDIEALRIKGQEVKLRSGQSLAGGESADGCESMIRGSFWSAR